MGATAALLGTGTAWASPALDEATPAESAEPTTEPAVAPIAPVAAEAPVDYGVGLRIRNVRVPAAILELFVERVPGGASNLGLGVELTRRRGTVEIQLGLEFDRITPTEGTWINKNEPVPAFQADYVLGADRAAEKLGWFTIEFTFLNHAVINKNFSIRYGGGAGLGIITGNLYRYDVMCSSSATNANPEPGCRPQALGGEAAMETGPIKYDLPPVFPVVNAIIGVQIKPIDKLVINIEGGIRTLPFFGTSIGYFF
ncbi:MAG: hypothetical protein H0T42_05580 [Deltaproteobacteria bacterium]|nr:hypothetical protein [Deltaproteobacteria bacterium]